MTILKRFSRDEAGATSIEYALIAVAIALAVITGATQIGAKLSPIFYNAANGVH